MVYCVPGAARNNIKEEETMKRRDAGMIFEKVRDILMEQLDVEESLITMDSVILDDLGADSLDIVDLVMVRIHWNTAA